MYLKFLLHFWSYDNSLKITVQPLCKFIGTKESFYIRKEFNSYTIGLEYKHGRRFIVLGHQYGRRDVM